MTDEGVAAIADYEVPHCPWCDKAHSFKLRVLTEPKADVRVPLFGGTGQTAQTVEVLFTCPATKKKFTQEVPKPPNGDVLGLASEADVAAAARSTAAPPRPPPQPDLTEWAKKSRDIAADFCKLMLSTSTGGIPIYFAVLKYLGFEKVGGAAASKLAVVPPVLLLAAAIVYVFALRPRFELLLPEEFDAFRRRRLEQLNKLIICGTATFAGAIALAILIMFFALNG